MDFISQNFVQEKQLYQREMYQTWLGHTPVQPQQKLVLKIYEAVCVLKDVKRDAWAERLVSLQEVCLVPFSKIGLEDGRLYVTRPYFNQPLSRLLSGGRGLSEVEAARLVAPLVQALSRAHVKGMVHGNLKRENLYLEDNGQIRLVDFSLSDLVTSEQFGQYQESQAMRYQAPEQFGGHSSEQSDQYALGCLLYELLTGHAPFESEDGYQLWLLHATEDPKPLSHFVPQISHKLEVTILKALAKDPGERYPDLAAFLVALQEQVVALDPLEDVRSSSLAQLEALSVQSPSLTGLAALSGEPSIPMSPSTQSGELSSLAQLEALSAQSPSLTGLVALNRDSSSLGQLPAFSSGKTAQPAPMETPSSPSFPNVLAVSGKPGQGIISSQGGSLLQEQAPDSFLLTGPQAPSGQFLLTGLVASADAMSNSGVAFPFAGGRPAAIPGISVQGPSLPPSTHLFATGATPVSKSAPVSTSSVADSAPASNGAPTKAPSVAGAAPIPKSVPVKASSIAGGKTRSSAAKAPVKRVIPLPQSFLTLRRKRIPWFARVGLVLAVLVGLFSVVLLWQLGAGGASAQRRSTSGQASATGTAKTQQQAFQPGNIPADTPSPSTSTPGVTNPSNNGSTPGAKPTGKPAIGEKPTRGGAGGNPPVGENGSTPPAGGAGGNPPTGGNGSTPPAGGTGGNGPAPVGPTATATPTPVPPALPANCLAIDPGSIKFTFSYPASSPKNSNFYVTNNCGTPVSVTSQLQQTSCENSLIISNVNGSLSPMQATAAVNIQISVDPSNLQINHIYTCSMLFTAYAADYASSATSSSLSVEYVLVGPAS